MFSNVIIAMNTVHFRMKSVINLEMKSKKLTLFTW